MVTAALRNSSLLTFSKPSGSASYAFFTKEPVTDYNSAMASDTKEYAKYFSYMLENGIYVAPSQFEAMFVSDAHSDDDIQKTVNSILSFK